MTIIEVVFWFVGQVAVAGVIYGTIKTELKNLHARVDSLHDDVRHVHTRFDNHIERRSTER